MRILIYSANFAPEKTGIGKYSGEMGAWLVEQGHDVRVVAAPPYYPKWEIDAEYAPGRYRRQLWAGLKIFRAPIWVPKSPTGLKRILHLLSFAISSFPVMLAQVLWRPEIVIVVAPAFMCAPTAWLTARLCNAKAWLHLQDFEVDCAFEMGLLKGAFLRKLANGLERTILRRFDCVSTISNRMFDRLLKKGVAPGHAVLFPNWVDTSRIKPLGRPSAYRAELGITPDKVVVLFSGTLGGKQGLMVIPQAAQLLLARPEVVFVVCGDGVMKKALEAEARNLPNLVLLPLQPFERLGELLAMADIHLLPQSPGAADLVLPSKLSGMLASGRPVIATCGVGTELHAVVSICGAVVAPENCQALAGIVSDLAKSPDLRRELGLKARAYALANFDRDAVLRKAFEKQTDVRGAVLQDSPSQVRDRRSEPAATLSEVAGDHLEGIRVAVFRHEATRDTTDLARDVAA